MQDVADAIRAQNISLPAGSFERGTQEIAAKTKGEVKTAARGGRHPLAERLGGGVRVRDVAHGAGHDGARPSTSSLDGHPAIGLVVRKQSGSNTVAVAEAVRRHSTSSAAPRARAASALAIPTDDSTYIAHSIHDVQFDLVFGALLAVAIILLFLRDLRATLISAVAIPTSVVGPSPSCSGSASASTT